MNTLLINRLSLTACYAASLVLLLCGCAAPPIPPIPFESAVHSFAVPTEGRPNAIRRVAVLPLIDHSNQPQQGELLRNAIAHHLRRKGSFEVLSPEKLGLAPCISPDLAQAAFAETMLVQMAASLQVDGVIILHGTEIRPYEPLRVALTLHLVDANDALTIATVDGVWDADDLATNAAAINYFSGKSVDWNLATEVNMVSPNRFYDFIGFDVATRLDQQLFPHRAAQTSCASGDICTVEGEISSQPDEGRSSESPNYSPMGVQPSPDYGTEVPSQYMGPLPPSGIPEEIPSASTPMPRNVPRNSARRTTSRGILGLLR